VPGLATLAPPLSILYLIHTLAVNVPYWDEWELVPLIAKLYAGTLTFADFWRQHNEHRVVFPKLILLGLARLSGWNVVAEIYLSLALAVLSFLFLWRLLSTTLGTTHAVLRPALVVLASWLVFTLAQGQNWLWGWELPWFLSNLSVVIAIWVLAEWPGQWRAVVFAALACVVANYSLASGLLLWGVILVGLLVQFTLWQWQKIVFWLVASGLSIGAYLYNYHSVTGHPSLFFVLRHPFIFATYILAYLGSPFGNWGGVLSATTALYGLAGIAALAIAAGGLWWQRAWRPSNALPWLLLVLFALLNAVLTGIGRAGFGLGQALSSRYATVAILFWIGWMVAVSVAFREAFLQLGRVGRWGSLVASAFVCVFMFLGYVRSYTRGSGEIEELSGQLRTGLSYLYQYQTAPDAPLLFLYPSPPAVRERAAQLDALDQGPFTFSMTTSNLSHSSTDSWTGVLNSGDYASRAYPGASITLMSGNASTVSTAEDILTFSNAGLAGSNFYVEATNASRWPLALPFWPLEVIDVQSKTALYINIYWNTGAGLNEQQKSTLYAFDGADGWKHFRAPIWMRLSGFRVDLHYPTADPTPDSLRIIVYDRLWP